MKIVRKRQMEKIKKVIKEEVTAVQITKDEFVSIAANECKEVFLQMASYGEPSELDVLVPMACAKFAAHLTARIFETDNEENEEREENENA